MSAKRLRPCLALLALLTATLWALDAAAYVREQANWNPASLPISYRINLASVPSSITNGAQAAIEGGFATWAAAPCTAWRATDAGSTTSVANSNDSQNTILWVSGSWPAELGDVSVTIGITTPVWEVGGYFIDADIQFNNVGFSWSLNPGSSSGSNVVDTQSIATHEEGHFLGLGHTPVASAIMYATYSGGIKRMLDPDDVSGVCAIYPGTGSMLPPTDAGTTAFDAGAPPPDAGTTPAGGVGQPCDASGFCAGNNECVCEGMNCFCTADCSSDPNVCPGGYTCDSDFLVCVPQGALGDPCNSGPDCSSGVCIDTGGGGACSQVCANDCTCPADFTCVPTNLAGTSVCVSGPNGCPSPPPDAGVPVMDAGSPPRDAGSSRTDTGTGASEPDAGRGQPGPDGGSVRADSGTPQGTTNAGDGAVGDDETGLRPKAFGCACTAPATPASDAPWTGVLVGLGLVLTRRRRPRR